MSEKVIPILAAPPSTPPQRMVGVLAFVAAICGSLIVAAHQGTRAAVEENRRIARERAVQSVLPEARQLVAYWALPSAAPQPAEPDKATPAEAIPFYAGYDAEGRLVGIAAEGAAKGYADTVRILFAWEPDSQTVRGFSVLASRETPGIGDKVTKDRGFLANFPLLVALTSDGAKLAREIRAVKHGTKTQPWQIDAIAGATITSRAVAKAINDSAQALLPRIRPHLSTLTKKP